MVTRDRVLVLQQSLVSALESLWHHSQLFVQLLLSLLTRLLNATKGQSGIGWVKKDLHDVDLLSSGVEHLLSSLIS